MTVYLEVVELPILSFRLEKKPRPARDFSDPRDAFLRKLGCPFPICLATPRPLGANLLLKHLALCFLKAFAFDASPSVFRFDCNRRNICFMDIFVQGRNLLTNNPIPHLQLRIDRRRQALVDLLFGRRRLSIGTFKVTQ